MKRRDFLKVVGIGAVSSALLIWPTHVKSRNLPNIVLIGMYDAFECGNMVLYEVGSG